METAEGGGATKILSGLPLIWVLSHSESLLRPRLGLGCTGSGSLGWSALLYWLEDTGGHAALGKQGLFLPPRVSSFSSQPVHLTSLLTKAARCGGSAIASPLAAHSRLGCRQRTGGCPWAAGGVLELEGCTEDPRAQRAGPSPQWGLQSPRSSGADYLTHPDPHAAQKKPLKGGQGLRQAPYPQGLQCWYMETKK